MQDGFTPLMAAAMRGHSDVVTVLLEYGVNTDHQTVVMPGAKVCAFGLGLRESSG